MCQGTICDFWCPCIFHPPSLFYFLPHGIHPPEFNFTFIHRPISDPLKAAKSKTSHNIVYSQFTPAYQFCEEYLHSPSFNPGMPLDMGGLCPAGNAITYQREGFISSRLCGSCVMGHCEQNMENVGVKTVKRSRYGWRSRGEDRERRARGRQSSRLFLSPADSAGGGFGSDAGGSGRSRSRSVLWKGKELERVRKLAEPVEDTGNVAKEQDDMSLGDLVEAMKAMTKAIIHHVDSNGEGLPSSQVSEGGVSSTGIFNRHSQPRVLPSDVKSDELWFSDLESLPDELMVDPPLLLPRIIPGGNSLDDWLASDGGARSGYDSDQETVVAGLEAVGKKKKGKEKDVALVEGAERVEERKRGRSQNRARRSGIGSIQPGQEPVRRLRFLRRGKSAARDAGSLGEGSRAEEKEIITIE